MFPRIFQLAVALLIGLGPLPAQANDAPILPPLRAASPPATGPGVSVGVEVAAGWMPAVGLWPAVTAAHGFTTTGAGLRVRLPRPTADWVMRLSILDLGLQDGNYKSRGYDWDDTQFVWFDPARFYFLQANREQVFSRMGRWRWSWSVGGGLGLLTGGMTLQNAQGCRPSNWRHADTDPAWGGCYHDPDPYGSTRVEFPPVMAFLHAAVVLSRRYGPATFSVEGGVFLPGFLGLSVAVEMDFPW